MLPSLTGIFPDPVEIRLPGGQNAAFALANGTGRKPMPVPA